MRKILKINEDNMKSVLPDVAKSIADRIPKNAAVIFDLVCVEFPDEGPMVFQSYFPRSVKKSTIATIGEFGKSVFTFDTYKPGKIPEEYGELFPISVKVGTPYKIWVNFI